jgi:hypothetical protein
MNDTEISLCDWLVSTVQQSVHAAVLRPVSEARVMTEMVYLREAAEVDDLAEVKLRATRIASWLELERQWREAQS